jgi:hypothetical protein
MPLGGCDVYTNVISRFHAVALMQGIRIYYAIYSIVVSVSVVATDFTATDGDFGCDSNSYDNFIT